MTRSTEKLAQARWVLRFAGAAAVGLVLSEAMEWTPSFLAPVFAGLLLAQLPGCLSLQMAGALVAVNLAAAGAVLLLTGALLNFPDVFLGVLAVLVFACFYWMGLGRPRLMAIIALLYLTIVPVVAIDAPENATAIAFALVRGFIVGIGLVWFVYLLWPAEAATDRAAAPAGPAPSAARLALAGTLVLVPAMVIFLVLGMAHALPVLVAIILVLSQLNLEASQRQAMFLITGNLVGGLAGLLVFALLAAAPSLFTLFLLVLLAGIGWGNRMLAGGAAAGSGFIANTTMLIVLGSGLLQGQAPLATWIERLAYVFIATAFAVGMMSLLWRQQGGTADAG